MLKTLTLKAVTPWPQFNEYEGEIVVEIDGRVGTVLDIRAERLTVDAGFPLSVDLDPGSDEAGGAP